MKVKKSTKKVCRVLLAAVMILSLSVSVFAYDAYISAGDVKVKTVSFTDLENNPLTSLTAGEMKVSTSVRSDVAGKSATLIACAYQGQEMIAMEKTTAALEAKKSTPMSLTLTVPAEATQVKAFVWDDLTGIYPYSQSAVFASGNVNVREILIDGVPLEGFSNDTASYTVNVNAGYLDYPEMTVRTEDASAKAEITTTDFAVENPVATIKVTNGANSKTFTVTYTKEAPAVTNVKINANNFKTVTGNDCPENSLSRVNLTTAVSGSTLMYTDRSWTYTTFPTALEGATVLQTALDLKNSMLNDTSIYNCTETFMDFQINRSAEVYVYVDFATSYKWITDFGFAECSDVIVCNEGGTSATRKLCKKMVSVNPGETKTVPIGFVKYGTNMPRVIVKFLDRAPETEMIQNAKFYNASTNLPLTTAVNVIKNVQADATDIQAFVGRTDVLAPIPTELNGASYIQMGKRWEDITGWSGSTPYYCTFELTQSAKVYVGLYVAKVEAAIRNDNAWTEGYAFETLSSHLGVVETTVRDYAFTKTYEVNPGETVLVKVGPFYTPLRPTDPYTAPFVFVKPE